MADEDEWGDVGTGSGGEEEEEGWGDVEQTEAGATFMEDIAPETEEPESASSSSAGSTRPPPGKRARVDPTTMVSRVLGLPNIPPWALQQILMLVDFQTAGSLAGTHRRLARNVAPAGFRYYLPTAQPTLVPAVKQFNLDTATGRALTRVVQGEPKAADHARNSIAAVVERLTKRQARGLALEDWQSWRALLLESDGPDTGRLRMAQIRHLFPQLVRITLSGFLDPDALQLLAIPTLRRLVLRDVQDAPSGEDITKHLADSKAGPRDAKTQEPKSWVEIRVLSSASSSSSSDGPAPIVLAASTVESWVRPPHLARFAGLVTLELGARLGANTLPMLATKLTRLQELTLVLSGAWTEAHWKALQANKTPFEQLHTLRIRFDATDRIAKAWRLHAACDVLATRLTKVGWKHVEWLAPVPFQQGQEPTTSTTSTSTGAVETKTKSAVVKQGDRWVLVQKPAVVVGAGATTTTTGAPRKPEDASRSLAQLLGQHSRTLQHVHLSWDPATDTPVDWDRGVLESLRVGSHTTFPVLRTCRLSLPNTPDRHETGRYSPGTRLPTWPRLEHVVACPEQVDAAWLQQLATTQPYLSNLTLPEWTTWNVPAGQEGHAWHWLTVVHIASRPPVLAANEPTVGLGWLASSTRPWRVLSIPHLTPRPRDAEFLRLLEQPRVVSQLQVLQIVAPASWTQGTALHAEAQRQSGTPTARWTSDSWQPLIESISTTRLHTVWRWALQQGLWTPHESSILAPGLFLDLGRLHYALATCSPTPPAWTSTLAELVTPPVAVEGKEAKGSTTKPRRTRSWPDEWRSLAIRDDALDDLRRFFWPAGRPDAALVTRSLNQAVQQRSTRVLHWLLATQTDEAYWKERSFAEALSGKPLHTWRDTSEQMKQRMASAPPAAIAQWRIVAKRWLHVDEDRWTLMGNVLRQVGTDFPRLDERRLALQMQAVPTDLTFDQACDWLADADRVHTGIRTALDELVTHLGTYAERKRSANREVWAGSGPATSARPEWSRVHQKNDEWEATVSADSILDVSPYAVWVLSYKRWDAKEREWVREGDPSGIMADGWRTVLQPPTGKQPSDPIRPHVVLTDEQIQDLTHRVQRFAALDLLPELKDERSTGLEGDAPWLTTLPEWLKKYQVRQMVAKEQEYVPVLTSEQLATEGANELDRQLARTKSLLGTMEDSFMAFGRLATMVKLTKPPPSDPRTPWRNPVQHLLLTTAGQPRLMNTLRAVMESSAQRERETWTLLGLYEQADEEFFSVERTREQEYAALPKLDDMFRFFAMAIHDTRHMTTFDHPVDRKNAREVDMARERSWSSLRVDISQVINDLFDQVFEVVALPPASSSAAPPGPPPALDDEEDE